VFGTPTLEQFVSGTHVSAFDKSFLKALKVMSESSVSVQSDKKFNEPKMVHVMVSVKGSPNVQYVTMRKEDFNKFRAFSNGVDKIEAPTEEAYQDILRKLGGKVTTVSTHKEAPKTPQEKEQALRDKLAMVTKRIQAVTENINKHRSERKDISVLSQRLKVLEENKNLITLEIQQATQNGSNHSGIIRIEPKTPKEVKSYALIKKLEEDFTKIGNEIDSIDVDPSAKNYTSLMNKKERLEDKQGEIQNKIEALFTANGWDYDTMM
jgi:signal recognition particle subunit SEC65